MKTETPPGIKRVHMEIVGPLLSFSRIQPDRVSNGQRALLHLAASTRVGRPRVQGRSSPRSVFFLPRIQHLFLSSPETHQSINFSGERRYHGDYAGLWQNRSRTRWKTALNIAARRHGRENQFECD